MNSVYVTDAGNPERADLEYDLEDGLSDSAGSGVVVLYQFKFSKLLI